MLPQVGLFEFLLISVVALIVVGPKDLPMMMRKIGQFVARGRAMASEFRSAFDDIARQAELDEMRREIEGLKNQNAIAELAQDISDIETDLDISANTAETNFIDSAKAEKSTADNPKNKDKHISKSKSHTDD